MKRLRWILMCDGLKRAHLPDGSFIDCALVRAHRMWGHKYGRFQPGAGPRGIAGILAFGDRLTDVFPGSIQL